MEYYLVNKRECSTDLYIILMRFKDSVLSKGSHIQRAAYYRGQFIRIFQKGQMCEERK